MFRTIWVHSGPFGCLTKLGAKRAELVQDFVPRSRFGIFRNEGTRSTPLDPKLTFRCISYYLCAMRLNDNLGSNGVDRETKLTFRCISYYLCAFGTVWLPY